MEAGAGIGIPCEETPLSDADLFAADEAFFTSTTREIVPIVQVDDLTIGDGLGGPITTRLLAEYRRQAAALTAASLAHGCP